MSEVASADSTQHDTAAAAAADAHTAGTDKCQQSTCWQRYQAMMACTLVQTRGQALLVRHKGGLTALLQNGRTDPGAMA